MTALALCRFAHFLAAMLAFGMSAYLWAYAPERLRLALSPVVRRLALIASVVALIAGLLWLALESASMADEWSAAVDPEAIGAVLTDTAFGHAWVLHLALAVALVVVVAFGPRTRWAATSLVSGALLAGLGLVGHAAMQIGAEGFLHPANHAAHLTDAGAWIGGFSFWVQLIVAAILLTGVVNIALTSHHPPLPPTTPYRALLVAKLVIVAIMILLALLNRFVLAPRLEASANALTTLRATSAVEVALGCVVVALVSVFALLDPA